MKIFSKFSAACAVIFLSTALAARADMASGTYTNLNMGAYVSLWDVSGEYSNDVPDLGLVDVAVVQEPSGKFTGVGMVEIDDDNNLVTTNVTVTGNVNGPSKKPELSLKLDYSITNVMIGSYNVKSLTEIFAQKFSFDLKSNALVGKGSGVVHSKLVYLNPKTGKYDTKGASTPIKGAEFPMASDTTGEWALVLTLTPDGTKYTGTAEIVTSAGNELDFTVTGVYSSEKDKSTLKLKGDAGTVTLKISTSGGAMTIDAIDGNISDQALNYHS